MKKMTDYDLQQQMLPGVSRTFALTIPQLQEPLCTVVTNAYLLCRIADTIEDDTKLVQAEKAHFHEQFRKVLKKEEKPEDLAKALAERLAPNTLQAEKDLVANIPVVIRCLRSFTPAQQQSLERCINIMSEGMPHFQRNTSLAGLENMASLDQYCYCVAGVVGEMLTELFCQYSPEIAIHRSELMPLAISFGQGLQMTNILKDFWEDRQRGVCWLPRDIFQKEGVDLANWQINTQQDAFNRVFRSLIKKASDHLQKALEYSMLMPSNEIGIRRFALWALGLAILTLRNLHHAPNFKCGSDVKVSRKTVRASIFVLNLSCRQNILLNLLFTVFAKKLA